MIYVFLLLIVLLFVLRPLFLKSKQGHIESISIEKAQNLLSKGAVLIDVREKNEVQALAFGVKEVLHLPLSQLDQRLKDIPQSVQLIIACRSGNRSKKAITQLMSQGFNNLLNLDGGITAWQAANGATKVNGKRNI